MSKYAFKLYNSELKERFLSQYQEDSQITHGYTLSKAYDEENFFEKDLYEFNIEEIKKVLYKINPINLRAAIRYGNTIKNYIDWAHRNGYAMSNINNPLQGMDSEWYQQFTGNKKTLFSYQEIREILKELVNFQDQLPILLAFEGVLGEDMSEQANLDFNSYDPNSNILKLKDDVKGERTIEVSDELVALIRRAHSETSYQYKNGTATGKLTERELPDSKFVLKAGSRSDSEQDAPISKFVLYRRLREIKDACDYPYLSYKSISKSGQVKMAVDLFRERGKLTNDELELVAIKFNLSKTMNNGESYNYSAIREYVNRDSILELYDIDIDNHS